jgi:hypothetical protein
MDLYSAETLRQNFEAFLVRNLLLPYHYSVMIQWFGAPDQEDHRRSITHDVASPPALCLLTIRKFSAGSSPRSRVVSDKVDALSRHKC